MALGKLYVLAGPIGNLSDITLRALEVLKNVDIILSEDTRETSKLLNHYQINKKQLSYRDQNHQKMLPVVLSTLKSGQNIALISDSGTPLISDPGFKLVEELISKNIELVPIPGPSAVIAALSASGLPTDKFSFLGFLPKKDSARKELLNTYGKLDATLVIYESPYRIERLLSQINEVLGNRTVCVARELTKKFEEIKTAPVQELLQNLPTQKGEFTILVAKEGYKHE